MNSSKKIKGVIVPMVSPFTAEETIDTTAVKKIIGHLAMARTSAFIQGTTGEALSISNEERIKFAEAAMEADRRGYPLYAGISHHSFSDSIDLSTHFIDLGIDFLVAHLPTFYSLNDEQIITYYERLADTVRGPLLIYNNPATVHMSIPINVVETLSHHSNIYGIKDSEQNMTRQKKLISLSKNREDFCHLLGWAAQSMRGLSMGSDGIVPSTGNVVPKMYKRLYDACRSGDLKTAEQLQKRTSSISAVYKKNKSLSEFLPRLKVMMSKLDLCEKKVLPPLIESSSEAEAQIHIEMKEIITENKLNVK